MKISFGANDLLASASFDQRVQYQDNYPEGIRNYRAIDYWYDDGNYGRLNSVGDPVYPSEANLKQLRGTGDNVCYVLNFVADAFEALRNAVRFQQSKNNLVNIEGTPFELVASAGWVSLNVAYTRHAQHFYGTHLYPHLLTPTVSEDIVDFDDFIEAFTQLADQALLVTPFTKTEYLMSKNSSPLMSGLVIELSDLYDHGSDLEKITDFINSNNFEVYREIANLHGFAVDRNAPWRLVALPGYPAMQRFMSKYGITLNTLFKKYYYTSYFLDIPSMKSHLFQYYQAFTTDSPEVRVPIVREMGDKKISLTKVIPRATLSLQDFLEKYNNLFWIRLYVYVRAKETNRDWNQHKFDHVVKEASDFFTYSTEAAAFKFINKEVRRFPSDQLVPYRRGSFRFKRKRKYREENR